MINQVQAGLILFYSCIDNLSWLNRKHESKGVTKSDFCDWVSLYYLHRLNRDVSAIDLYAARCALIHSGTPDSLLSKEMRARKIFYSYGKGEPDELSYLIRSRGKNDFVVLHVDEMIDAFEKSITDFLCQDERMQVFIERSKSLFIDIRIIE